jgi:hypothetical protein
MAGSALSNFPQELIDKIIDHVRWNELHRPGSGVMRTCSLISRTWLPRSRYHLFDHVTLRADRNQPKLFLKLLGSLRGTIAPYVRHLELHEGRATSGWDKNWLNKGLPQLAVMTAVESICIWHGNFEQLDDTAIAAWFSNLGRVTSLRLEYCSFSSPLQFINMLSSAPHIEHLSLDVVKAVPRSSNKTSIFPASMFERRRLVAYAKKTGPSPASVSPPSHAAHLRVLEMSDCGFMGEFLTWLQTGVQVDTLRLDIASANNIPAYSELMRMLGSSLAGLDIQFPPSFGEFQSAVAGMCLMILSRTMISLCTSTDAFIREVDLTGNDHLRSICLPSANIRGHHPGVAKRFPRFLSRISSPRIEEVFMDISVSSLSQLDFVDWHTIGRIFERPNFLHLRRVLITIHAQLLAYWRPEFRDKAPTWLDDRLPGCCARGILEVKLK